MSKLSEKFNKTQLRKDLPDVCPGDIVYVHQKIKESPKGKSAGKEEKDKTQIFKGVVIARKHGKGISSTITVRRVVSGVGVERIFPLNSPLIEKIEIVRRGKVRRAKLYYLRTATGRKARLKLRKFAEPIVDEKPKPEELKEKNEKKPAEPEKQNK